MADLFDIYKQLNQAPANAAGADSVSSDYRNPFEKYMSTPNKDKTQSIVENIQSNINQDSLPTSRQYSTEDYESFIKYGLSPSEVSDYEKLVKQRFLDSTSPFFFFFLN